MKTSWSENPLRLRPSRFRPRSSALSPATIMYLGTSCATWFKLKEWILIKCKENLILKRLNTASVNTRWLLLYSGNYNSIRIQQAQRGKETSMETTIKCLISDMRASLVRKSSVIDNPWTQYNHVSIPQKTP